MVHGLPKRLLPFFAILPLVIIFLLGQKFSSIFQYDRSSIINGEYWRIITCHFVHMGKEHLFLNLTGAILIFFLFFRLYSIWGWLVGTTCCMAGIGLGLLFFCPHLDWYMGLSGVLHGLLMMGIIGEIKKGGRLYFLVLAAVVGKLAVEHFFGPSIYSSQFINAAVISNAHVSGATAGGLFAIVMHYTKRILPVSAIGLAAKPVG